MPFGARDLGEMRLLEPRADDFRHGWSPVVTESGACFVGWWEPTEVFRFNGETGDFGRVALRMAPHSAERFHGGSQGVAVPGGYLFLVNETITRKNGAQATHVRFVRVDEEFRITGISPQFFVTDRGWDTATGLARQGERVIAGFRPSSSWCRRWRR